MLRELPDCTGNEPTLDIHIVDSQQAKEKHKMTNAYI